MQWQYEIWVKNQYFKDGKRAEHRGVTSSVMIVVHKCTFFKFCPIVYKTHDKCFLPHFPS